MVATAVVDAPIAVETGYAPYSDFAFAEPEIIALAAACETAAKVGVCDFVASVEDSASVYFAAYEIERVVVAYETEATVAACDSAEEVADFAFV